VARDSTSQFPADVEALPDVGYMRACRPEGVLSVDPDLIIALEGAGPPETIEVLKRASVPIVFVPETFDRDGVVDKIEIVGAALGADRRRRDGATGGGRHRGGRGRRRGVRQRAFRHVRPVRARRTHHGVRNRHGGQRHHRPGRRAQRDHEYEGYRQLTDEAVIEAAPDFILMMDRGGEHDPSPAELTAIPAVASTPAGAENRIIRMDGSYLLGFGPRTAAAVRDLAERPATPSEP
jgi:iron complex transport system substrate-binding protein